MSNVMHPWAQDSSQDLGDHLEQKAAAAGLLRYSQPHSGSGMQGARGRRLTASATVIQAAFRAMHDRRAFLRTRAAVLRIQAALKVLCSSMHLRQTWIT